MRFSLTVLAILALVVLSNVSFADRPICVRNYMGDDPNTPCEKFKDAYTYVMPLTEVTKKVCTRIYLDFYCSNSPKEYEWVHSIDKSKICVLNYNQPPVANFCQSVPQFYDYIEPNLMD